MRCLWSTETGLNAALTRLIHGGSATHCAVMMADGWVLDSQPCDAVVLAAQAAAARAMYQQAMGERL